MRRLEVVEGAVGEADDIMHGADVRSVLARRGERTLNLLTLDMDHLTIGPCGRADYMPEVARLKDLDLLRLLSLPLFLSSLPLSVFSSTPRRRATLPP